MTTQPEQSLNFFHTTNELVNKTSFKKLLFLSLSTVVFGFTLAPITTHVETYLEKESILQNKIIEEKTRYNNKTNYLKYQFNYNAIQKIPPDEFNNFINYLNFHESLYQSNFELISSSILATIDNKKYRTGDNRLLGHEDAKRLLSLHRKYQQSLNKVIAQAVKIKQKCDSKAPVNIQELYNTMSWYYSFQGKIMVLNPSLEKESDKFYYSRDPWLQSNVNYNRDHKILNTYLKIKKDKFDSLFTQKQDPNITTKKTI